MCFTHVKLYISIESGVIGTFLKVTLPDLETESPLHPVINTLQVFKASSALCALSWEAMVQYPQHRFLFQAPATKPENISSAWWNNDFNFLNNSHKRGLHRTMGDHWHVVVLHTAKMHNGWTDGLNYNPQSNGILYCYLANSKYSSSERCVKKL